MTFRPSDDVLDNLANDSMQNTTDLALDEWRVFGEKIDEEVAQNLEGLDVWKINWSNESQNSNGLVNSPDFSAVFKEIANDTDMQTQNMQQNVINESSSEWNLSENYVQKWLDTSDLLSNAMEHEYDWLEDSNHMTDEDRINIVSKIDDSGHSVLDLLVDDKWYGVIEKYNKIYHIVFRWWISSIVVVLWVLLWVLSQVNAKQVDDISLWRLNIGSEIGEPQIQEAGAMVLKDKVDNLSVIVPYGFSSLNWKFLQSKSNLIVYDWIVLPQVSYIDSSSGLFSLEKFTNKEMSREDIEDLVKILITDSAIYKKTANLPDVKNIKSRWYRVEAWLIKWFNLSCLDTEKISDFFCDKFLYKFYDQGKYYDLSIHWKELLDLVKDLMNQGKDLEPVCNLVHSYTLRSWVSSDELSSVLRYCQSSDVDQYKMLVNFIKVENSLWQPELSEEIFDDSYLNAYKLLSAQQNVYKILEGTAVNKNFIISYLKFVQALINKDRWSNKYIGAIYKDMLYVFNMDVLYNKLLSKWELSSDIKSMLDQINNGHVLYWYSSLVSQLTVKDIVQGADFSSSITVNRTVEELFLQYYSMTDRLKIRKVDFLSDSDIRVQTEIFTDEIFRVTSDKTLKATVSLYRMDNVLYVKSINIANQSKLSDILNIYAENEYVSFYAMLAYIDEQIWFWYEPEDDGVKWNLCDNISEREDVSVYECDDNHVVLYKWDVEYNFSLIDWILDTFTIENEELDSIIREKLWNVMIMKDNTPAIIKSIVDFELEDSDTDNIEKKLEVITQFRMYLKMEPNVYDVDWEVNKFLVEFRLWEFNLQAYYDVNTKMLTKISYVNCDKILEIRNLTIEVSWDNESQLIEILNNPKVFLTQTNPAAYKKYQQMCEEPQSWW